MKRCLAWVFGLTLAIFPTVAEAQNQMDPPPTVISIRPAQGPVPALKYHLLPERRELIAGNAALFYHRAIERLIETRYRQQIQARDLAQKSAGKPSEPAPDESSVEDWLSKPIRDLPLDAVTKTLDLHAVSLREVELGARREFCEWEFRRRDEGYQLILSDIQETRSLGRLIALKARLELAEGRIDSAIHWIQTGLVLAQHVCESTTLVQSLVGSSIAIQMSTVLEDLVQNPSAPNLYWALTGLPRPFVELTSSLENERYTLEQVFPRLLELEKGPWTLEQARAFSEELQSKGAMLFAKWARSSSTLRRPEMKDMGEHLLFTGRLARSYPEAKRALLASGYTSIDVEAMPIVQVVALHSYRVYQKARDDVFKWASLPYWQGQKGMSDAEQNCWKGAEDGLQFIFMMPAVRSVYLVPVRVDRHFAILRTIEAIRQYSADHEGKLPASLEELTAAPAPTDPATGKPFGYTSDGSIATLTAPAPLGREPIKQFQVRYELKLIR